jgi:hypothetical protein
MSYNVGLLEEALAWYGNVANPRGVVGQYAFQWFAGRVSILNVMAASTFSNALPLFISRLVYSPVSAVSGLVVYFYFVEQLLTRYFSLVDLYDAALDHNFACAVQQFQNYLWQIKSIANQIEFFGGVDDTNFQRIRELYNSCSSANEAWLNITDMIDVRLTQKGYPILRGPQA